MMLFSNYDNTWYFLEFTFTDIKHLVVVLYVVLLFALNASLGTQNFKIGFD